MAANPKDPRTKRRQAMGDDPNKVAMAPQPLPGAPQKNNVMNYPMTDMAGQMGQQIGSGQGQFPYGDINMDKATAQQLGSVGFVGNSGQPQGIVPGKGMNSRAPYNAQAQPNNAQMAELEPMYEMASAAGKTMPNGLNNNQPVSYNISPMGPSGGAPVPGSFPGEMNYIKPDQLAIGGQGMSTGRGGGRNKPQGK